jgi:hypothetical protein
MRITRIIDPIRHGQISGERIHDVDTRRRATAPAFFVYLTKRVFFSIGGNKDFIGVAI